MHTYRVWCIHAYCVAHTHPMYGVHSWDQFVYVGAYADQQIRLYGPNATGVGWLSLGGGLRAVERRTEGFLGVVQIWAYGQAAHAWAYMQVRA